MNRMSQQTKVCSLCDDGDEDTVHYLVDCANFGTFRTSLFRDLGKLTPSGLSTRFSRMDKPKAAASLFNSFWDQPDKVFGVYELVKSFLAETWRARTYVLYVRMHVKIYFLVDRKELLMLPLSARKGFQYQLGDFQVKAGRAVLSSGEHLRGIIMEVEYVPVSSIEQTRLLLQEFVEVWQEVVTGQNLSGRFTHLEPNYSDYNLPDKYCWQHTALHYVTLMVYFMSSPRS